MDEDLAIPSSVLLSDFDFDVPDDLVAQSPIEPRDQARLLIRRVSGQVNHTQVCHLTTELPERSVLVVNDTRVIPSRVLAHTAYGGQVEIFLIENVGSSTWRILAKPLKKLKPGTILNLPGNLSARVEQRDQMMAVIDLGLEPSALLQWLEKHAFIPLPPYIKRKRPCVAEHSPDRQSYQTVYAHENGSVAAPTAGLHFTRDLIAKLEAKNIEICSICLHVGAGTFLPVKANNIDQHVMHNERFLIPRLTLSKILQAKKDGRPVIAVGTTSLRALETTYQAAQGQRDQMLESTGQWQQTNLFLRPKHREERYTPTMIDGLWTNFHQPRSTLFMLVSTLIGIDEAHRLYRIAIENKYRLFSYGDASLLWLNDAYHPKT